MADDQLAELVGSALGRLPGGDLPLTTVRPSAGSAAGIRDTVVQYASGAGGDR